MVALVGVAGRLAARSDARSGRAPVVMPNSCALPIVDESGREWIWSTAYAWYGGALANGPLNLEVVVQPGGRTALALA